MFYYVNDSQNPILNQATEEFLFQFPIEEDILWLWRNDPAVVFGCYQNPFAEIDLATMWEKDVKIVRRITGGGTVYHDPGNVNYSMISRATAATNYDPYLYPVIRALQEMGYPVEKKNSCDIYLGHAKVSGSAQKTSAHRVLHHGTLLFDCDLDALRASATKKAAQYEAKGVKSRPAHVGNLSEALADKRSVEQFREELQRRLLPKDAKALELTEADRTAIQKIADAKYDDWNWTFGHAPAHMFRAELQLEKGAVALVYHAKKGVVQSAEISPILGHAKQEEGSEKPDVGSAKQEEGSAKQPVGSAKQAVGHAKQAVGHETKFAEAAQAMQGLRLAECDLRAFAKKYFAEVSWKTLL